VDFVDFILNLAGLLLWINWRAARLTIEQAETCDAHRHIAPAPRRHDFDIGTCLRHRRAAGFARAVLLADRLGCGLGWKLDLGVTTIFFRSNLFGEILLFSVSVCANARNFYLWLLLLSILSGPQTIHRLVKIQLGEIDGWRRWIEIYFASGGDWHCFGGWQAGRSHGCIQNQRSAAAQRIEEALVIGFSSYLVWKFSLAHCSRYTCLNSYIYFGKIRFGIM